MLLKSALLTKKMLRFYFYENPKMRQNKVLSFSEKEDRSWVNFFHVKSLLPEPLFDERRFNYVFSHTIDHIYA